MKRTRNILVIIIILACTNSNSAQNTFIIENNVGPTDFEQISHFVPRDPDYVLDSILRIGLTPNDTVQLKYFYSYYNNGKLKSWNYVIPSGSYEKTKSKYEYEYDQDGRRIKVIKYKGQNDTSWIPYMQITYNWFENNQIIEQIKYFWNGEGWSPNKRFFSPNLSDSDTFTTYYFAFNNDAELWDTLYRTISHLNEHNLVDTIYRKSLSMDQLIYRSTIEYTPALDTLDYFHYSTSNNGGSFSFESRIQFIYDNEGNLLNRYDWMPAYGTWVWYYMKRWSYDEDNRVIGYYTYSYTPVHPDVLGGLIFKYYYLEFDLVHHRNVFYFNGDQYANDFFYYSDFYVGYDENKLIESLVYPNPFTNSTTIEYHLDYPMDVTLTIFNHLVKQVELIRQNQQQGKQQITWHAEGLPSGMYFYTLKTGNQVATGKLLKID